MQQWNKLQTNFLPQNNEEDSDSDPGKLIIDESEGFLSPRDHNEGECNQEMTEVLKRVFSSFISISNTILVSRNIVSLKKGLKVKTN